VTSYKLLSSRLSGVPVRCSGNVYVRVPSSRFGFRRTPLHGRSSSAPWSRSRSQQRSNRRLTRRPSIHLDVTLSTFAPLRRRCSRRHVATPRPAFVRCRAAILRNDPDAKYIMNACGGDVDPGSLSLTGHAMFGDRWIAVPRRSATRDALFEEARNRQRSGARSVAERRPKERTTETIAFPISRH